MAVAILGPFRCLERTGMKRLSPLIKDYTTEITEVTEVAFLGALGVLGG
jgi:hypothetical protein